MKLHLCGTSVNSFIWWRVPGSNRWPPACKAGALPAELTPHFRVFSFFRSGGPRTRFSAEKPRRLQVSTGHLPRAAFRVHFGVLAWQISIASVLTPIWNFLEVVGQNGLEPSTSRLSVVCSSQLSYWPISTSHFLGTCFPVPSKLNNALTSYPCTDLRTLLIDAL